MTMTMTGQDDDDSNADVKVKSGTSAAAAAAAALCWSRAINYLSFEVSTTATDDSSQHLFSRQS